MKKIIITFYIFFLFFLPVASLADSTQGSGGTEDPVTIDNPLATGGEDPTPQILIGRIINATMGLVGSLALAMFIYGGFVWMLAAGNEQNVQKGKGVLTWATIGLIVIFSSYALVRVIFSGLGVE